MGKVVRWWLVHHRLVMWWVQWAGCMRHLPIPPYLRVIAVRKAVLDVVKVVSTGGYALCLVRVELG